MMTAVTRDGYGDPDVLSVGRVPVPSPEPDQVLVEVVASSVNPADWHHVTGKPYMMRLQSGLRRPKMTIPGLDLAGTVVAIGSKVTDRHVGERVYGEVGGGWAQYAAVAADRVAPLPDSVGFEQAAATPVAGLTALQGLRDHAGLGPDGPDGARVLINGASGGVGSFAVQIARAWGAEVTGVCSTANLGLVEELGADHVVDYRSEDVTALDRRFDVIFDLAASHGLGQFRRILEPGGIYLPCSDRRGGAVLGPLPWMVGVMTRAKLARIRTGFLLAEPVVADLETLAAMLADGSVTAAIGSRHGLDEVPGAVADQAGGSGRGKRVVRIDLG
ncbi:MAG: NAD(P)-dependent alcohol dehydrogenase [Actinomycetota bacterium]